MINWLRTGIILLAACGYAFAQQGRPVGPNPTATGTAATGQIPGTATNDSATAGNVGEYATAAAWNGAATNTFTNASPTVVTWTGHPYPINSSGIVAVGAYYVTNSGGAVPTGLTASTNYFFVPIDANTGHLATSVANALAGTFINTTSTGTGTQTGNAAVILATNTPLTIAAVSFTAGDWQVSAINRFLPGATDSVTGLITSISLTTNTIDNTTLGASTSSGFGTGQTLTATFYDSQSVGPIRKSFSSTTTVFLVAQANTAVNYTGTVGGVLKAIRSR